ncbi:M3 family oligoendopeptidase [Thermodesulfobacteriota bacterium]
MFDSLPKYASGILDWSWSSFEPYVTDLTDRSLAEDSVGEFLADWSHLGELVSEVFARLNLAAAKDISDKDAEQRYYRFLEEILPKAIEADQKLKEKLLAQDTAPPSFELPLRKMRVEAELFREENLPLITEEQKLCTEYDKIVGSRTVIWEGKEITLIQLQPFFQDPDRVLREKAWRTSVARRIEDRQAISDLWARLLDIRVREARNADYGDYRSFRWKELHRFDYTPEDCLAFHEAIEEAVVPVALRVTEKRRKAIGVESIRPWDTKVDPAGRPALVPFTEASDLEIGVRTIFEKVDPALGAYFRIMREEGLLDLANRKNKRPGGFCTEFQAIKRPFIFMNAVGVHDDVQTLLHESGHAFHVFESNHLPYVQQRDVGIEFAEVASMGMELIASPYLRKDEGGFYDPSDAARAVIEHLEQSILFWPYMAVVDAFQHWVYGNAADAADGSKCCLKWLELMKRFLPWIDYSGLDEETMIGWQSQLHIHTAPFYYVEYGLAQLGAAQVWANSLEDQAAAVASYRRALALGGTVSVPDLFSAAGAKFSFDAEVLGSAAQLMERTIDRLSRQ